MTGKRNNRNTVIAALGLSVCVNLAFDFEAVFPNNAIQGIKEFLCRFENESGEFERIPTDSELGNCDFDWRLSIFVLVYVMTSLPGAVLGASLSDRIGRRTALLICIVLTVPGRLLQFLAYYSRHPWTLIFLGRFLSGLSGNAAAVIFPVFITEISSSGIRGQMGSLQVVMFAVGSLLGVVAGLPEFFGTADIWLNSYVLLSLVGVSTIPILLWVKESPAYLLAKNPGQGYEAAAESLIFYSTAILHPPPPTAIGLAITVGNDCIANETNSGTSEDMALVETDAGKGQEEGGYDLLKLFTDSKTRTPLLLAVAISFSASPVDFLGFFSTLMLISASIPEIGAMYETIGLVALELMLSVLCLFTIDRYGRRPLYLLSVWGLTLSFLVLALSQLFIDTLYMDANLLLQISFGFALIAYAIFINLGIRTLKWIVIPELFPMRYRASAKAVAYVVFNSGNLISLPFPYLAGRHLGFTIYFGYLILLSGSAVYTQMRLPETSGKEPAEIFEGFSFKRMDNDVRKYSSKG